MGKSNDPGPIIENQNMSINALTVLKAVKKEMPKRGNVATVSLDIQGLKFGTFKVDIGIINSLINDCEAKLEQAQADLKEGEQDTCFF